MRADRGRSEVLWESSDPTPGAGLDSRGGACSRDSDVLLGRCGADAEHPRLRALVQVENSDGDEGSMGRQEKANLHRCTQLPQIGDPSVPALSPRNIT